MTDALSDDDTFSPAPKVIGAPDRIWLCYGELERDDDHSALHQIQDVVTWCEDSVFPSDVQYIRADLIQQQAEELETLRAHDQIIADANKELHDAGEQQAQAMTDKDAEIDRLRADAGRYRWLRMKTAGLRDNEGRQYFSFPSIFGLRPVGNIMQGSVGQHLDAAIDAALRTEKP